MLRQAIQVRHHLAYKAPIIRSLGETCRRTYMEQQHLEIVRAERAALASPSIIRELVRTIDNSVLLHVGNAGRKYREAVRLTRPAFATSKGESTAQ